MPASIAAEPEAFSPHDHRACRGRALKAAAAVCAERRLRLTPARAFVLERLLASHRAMTAYEILQELAEAGLGSQPPVAYRALDFLVANGLAHRIERLGAFAACAHAEAAHNAGFLDLPRLPPGRRDAAAAPCRRAHGGGGGDRLQHRADGDGGRGALRPLPRGGRVTRARRSPRRGDVLRRAPGARGGGPRARGGRDRDGGGAERLGEEHAPAPADRRRAAGRGAGDPRPGAQDRLRAAEARRGCDAADDRRPLPRARRGRRASAGAGAGAGGDRGTRRAAAGRALGRPVPAGAAGAGAAAAAGAARARRGGAGPRPAGRGALLPADRADPRPSSAAAC